MNNSQTAEQWALGLVKNAEALFKRMFETLMAERLHAGLKTEVLEDCEGEGWPCLVVDGWLHVACRVNEQQLPNETGLVPVRVQDWRVSEAHSGPTDPDTGCHDVDIVEKAQTQHLDLAVAVALGCWVAHQIDGVLDGEAAEAEAEYWARVRADEADDWRKMMEADRADMARELERGDA